MSDVGSLDASSAQASKSAVISELVQQLRAGQISRVQLFEKLTRLHRGEDVSTAAVDDTVASGDAMGASVDQSVAAVEEVVRYVPPWYAVWCDAPLPPARSPPSLRPARHRTRQRVNAIVFSRLAPQPPSLARHRPGRGLCRSRPQRDHQGTSA